MVILDLYTQSKLNLSPGKSMEYISLLQKGVNDEDAAHTLYPDDKWAKQKLQNLKSALKKKLIANIVSQEEDSGGSNTAINMYSQAHKTFAVGKVLIGKSLKTAGIELITRSYQLAIKSKLTGIALEAAKDLALHYSVIIGNQEKYNRYRKEVERLIKVQEIEVKAQLYYSEISSAYNHKWRVKGDVKSKAIQYAKEIEGSIGTSIRSAIYYYNILAFAYLSANDHKEVLLVCQEADNFFVNNEASNRATRVTFLIRKITALIELKRFAEAEVSINDVLNIVEKGKYNYNVACFYRGIVGLHSEDMQLTKKALDQTKEYRTHLPAHFQEQWLLLEAYAAFLSENGFQIGRFLNQVPKFSKDKAGANAAIIIAQMLHFLKQGRTNEYIDRCESIEKYSRRHLSGRTMIFIKILLKIPKGRFYAIAVKERIKKLEKQLSSCERNEIEIVPYELLLQKVFQLLF